MIDQSNPPNEMYNLPPIKEGNLLNQIRFWKKISAILSIIIFLSVSFIVSKYLARLNDQSVDLPIENRESRDLSYQPYFQRQMLDISNNQISISYFMSPDVLTDQKNNVWEPLECVYSDLDSNHYDFPQLSESLNKTALINGLQTIEDHKFKFTLRNEDGSLFEENSYLQNIRYTEICKDEQNYYVLFLTTGKRNDIQGSLFVNEVSAGGGYLGNSNFAIIPFTGETIIYEDITEVSKKIVVNDLVEAGFSSATSRDFAYYYCHSFQGKLGENLYALCTGDGGRSLIRISPEPFLIDEISFCWQKRSEYSRICYDSSGKAYYKSKWLN